MTTSPQPQRTTRSRRVKPEPIPEPIQELESEQYHDITHDITPCKNIIKKPRKPLFRRGNNVLCLLISPGERTPELVKLRKTENTIVDRNEDRLFIVSTGPALTIKNKSESMDCYVLDAEKGCSVDLVFGRDNKLATMHTNPETTFDLIDQNFISQFVDLKPDWRAQMGFGIFCGLIAFLAGLMF